MNRASYVYASARMAFWKGMIAVLDALTLAAEARWQVAYLAVRRLHK